LGAALEAFARRLRVRAPLRAAARRLAALMGFLFFVRRRAALRRRTGALRRLAFAIVVLLRLGFFRLADVERRVELLTLRMRRLRRLPAGFTYMIGI